MKIAQFKVENLFNSFTHVIDFKNETGITLMLGQNGLGKTVMLNLIKSIFSYNFDKVLDVCFSKAVITFDNNNKIELQQQIEKDNIHDLIFYYYEKDNLISQDSLHSMAENSDKAMREIREYILPYYRRFDENEWVDRRSGERCTTNELILLHNDLIPKEILTKWRKYPIWLTNVIDLFNVDLIETQRLLTTVQIEERYSRPHKEYRNTVEEYSKELLAEINAKLASSTELAAKLDRTYPNRLIERLKNISDISQKDLNSKLNDLEIKRKRLSIVGLIDLNEEPVLQSISNQERAIKEVLLVYIDDSNKKLEVYDSLADKIELLMRIINSRFLFKKLSINRDTGFNFVSTKNGQPIDLNKLSSGEQHMLILFYQLLFKYSSQTLLLIDEPEISLHISWQKRFIEDLQQILKLNSMEILIATHSPSIIGKNWGLTVDLDKA